MFGRLILLCMAFVCCFSQSAFARDKIKVVATLTTFADLVKQIGKERVEAQALSAAKFNPHFYEPKPSDVLKTQKADLFVHAGLDLELWRYPLVEAAGNPDILPGGKKELALSEGISLLEAPQTALTRLQGDVHIHGNPHYWVDPRNAAIMAGNIAEKLKEIDPLNSSTYDKNLNEFLRKLDDRIIFWQNELSQVKGREIVAYHNEWIYLTEFAGIRLSRYLEPKPGIPPAPKHLASLEEYIKENKVSAIVQPTYFPKSYSQDLAGRANIKVIILAQNVGEVQQAEDYFSMMDYNVKSLKDVL